MTDMSHLDSKYFIDRHVYNCPFCNRRNVRYEVERRGSFDWSNAKQCYYGIVTCSSCEKKSLHLSYFDVVKTNDYSIWIEVLSEDQNIDDLFFYSVPTSFFVLDDRIPAILRELMTEAEGCLKSNFLTGASACARKIIYELASRENAEGDDYTTRVKSLKTTFPNVDDSYFDTLVAIKDATSKKVHEDSAEASESDPGDESFDIWESGHIRLFLGAIKDVLNEIYVVPKVRKQKQDDVQRLRQEILGTHPPSDSQGSS